MLEKENRLVRKQRSASREVQSLQSFRNCDPQLQANANMG